MVDPIQQVLVSLGQGEAGVAAELLESATPTDALGESLFFLGDAYADAEIGSPADERVLELTGDLQVALNLRDSRRARTILGDLGTHLRTTPREKLRQIAAANFSASCSESAKARQKALGLWKRLEVPSTIVRIEKKEAEEYFSDQCTRIAAVLDELLEKKQIDRETYDRCHTTLLRCHTTLLLGLHLETEHRRLQKKGFLTYTISLWQRNEAERRHFGFSKESLADPSNQVLVVRNFKGEIIGGMVLRLFQDIDTQKKGIFYSFSKGVEEHLPKAIYDKLMEISKAHVVSRSTYPVEQLPWPILLPFVPVNAPPKTEVAARLILARPHPHRDFHYITDGAVYEAMKRVEGARVVANPWLENNFPLDLGDLGGREIEPDPKVDKARDYLWPFVSGSFGRSVDYYLGNEGLPVQGVHWHHLSGIGVGRTLNARIGNENRDGRLSLEVAWQRFYLTNLLHTIAGDVGFRTSLGVAVTDFGRERKGFEPRVEGAVYELRRENLRLWDLEKADLEMSVKIIDYVREKMAKTREEYVQWLAKTLGEQFAIMEYFGFDHGMDDGDPQLHSGNVSLLGEIFDTETGRFCLKEARYHNNSDVGECHVDMEHIRQMQEVWQGTREKNEKMEEPTWVERLLDFAPQVDFYRELQSAHDAKLAELKASGIDPKQRIRDFNRRFWVPFIREVRYGFAP